jgi:hypothetical protein
MSDKNKINFYNIIIKCAGKIITFIQITTFILYISNLTF